jgi:hypothetical protein
MQNISLMKYSVWILSCLPLSLFGFFFISVLFALCCILGFHDQLLHVLLSQPASWLKFSVTSRLPVTAGLAETQ